MRKKIVFLLVYILLFTIFLPVYVSSTQIDNNDTMNREIIDIIPSLRINENNPPYPPVIEGPTNGKIGVTYLYNITVTDPDEEDHLFKLEIDFGDGINSEECGCNRPWENGEVIEVTHRWKRSGDYEVTARVQDIAGEWSDWSDPFTVNMPKSRQINRLYLQFMGRFIEHLPFLISLLDL